MLSNLGLSYALSKDLKQAEETLRRAAGGGRIDPRVRQNLALVVGLQGRASRKPKRSRALTCRRKKPPPTSPISGKC